MFEFFFLLLFGVTQSKFFFPFIISLTLFYFIVTLNFCNVLCTFTLFAYSLNIKVEVFEFGLYKELNLRHFS